ncbi:FecR family protein [Marinoscillum sp.]|uniref:FecR family protein n=1 Tax=Marinoscillum sp. TaxID=2024838 RepID=UPI003BA9CFD1
MNPNDDTFLARWLNDELSAEERKEFESNPEYASFRKIVAGADSLQRPEFDEAAIRNRIEQSKHTTGSNMWWYAAAACACLILAVTLAINWTTTLTSEYGTQLAYDLPDGSSVLLNAKSELRLKKWNWESDRSVRLTGEAYFDVEKGKTFTVVTYLGEVTVLGTEFNVTVAEGFMEVTCYEGSVRVNIGATESILAEGDRVTWLTDRLTQTAVDWKVPDWKTGISSFQSIPLKYVVAELESQYGIEVNNLQLLDLTQPFTGQFPHDDVKVALSIVFEPLNLAYQQKGDQVYLEPM